MKIKAIFFDIGKTLVDDPFPKAKQVIGRFLAQRGLLEENRLEDFNNTLTLANTQIDNYMFSHFWGEEEIISHAMADFQIYDTELINQSLVAYRDNVKNLYNIDNSLKALSNSELSAFLSRLKASGNFVVGIISDERIASIPLYWEVLECEEFFSIVVTSEEVGYRKPCERIFNYALRQKNLRAEECIYVGDNIIRDIAGANNIGMTSVLFTKFQSPNIVVTDTKPDFIIDDLRELELLDLLS